MRRSQAAADILAQLQACMGPLCQQYVFSRTRGVPPADCNSVTVQWIDRSKRSFADCEDDCREWQAAFGMRITLTRVCMGPDQEPAFDWSLEDAESACFDDHLEILEDCVDCGDWSQVKIDHSLEAIRYENTEYDIEANGGAFSAYIELTLIASECC